MTSLIGRQGLVVGGSTGIGRAIADAWSQAGMNIRILSRSRPRDLNKLQWSAIDLTDQSSAQRVLLEIAREPLYAVCFAAVHYGDRRSAFSDVTLSEWRQQLEVNLNGLWLTLAATLPTLRLARPGLFLNVSSEVVFNGGPGRVGYAATKAACASILNSVYQEEDHEKVHMISVLPASMVDSAGIRRRRPPDFDYSSYMQPDSFGRVAVELLTTEGARYNGDNLVVLSDGSYHSVGCHTPVSQSGRGRI